jgi:hypothetical protein
MRTRWSNTPELSREKLIKSHTGLVFARRGNKITFIKCAICGKDKRIYPSQNFLKTCGSKDCKREYRGRFYRYTEARRQRQSQMAKARDFGKWNLGRKGSERQREVARAGFLGSNNPKWVPIGSTHLTGDRQYVMMKVAEGQWRKQHVVFMERKIGRRLEKNEVVHHINGNKHDNRIENLQLMTNREHGLLHWGHGLPCKRAA